MGRAAAAAAPRRATAHAPRTRHQAGSASYAGTRRRSGAGPRVNAQGAAAVTLPVRVVNAPFTRAARARTSRVLDSLLAGRGWIALVFLLLAGIVFFNVDLLQMNREIAQNAETISTLKRDNARLLLEEARLANSERVQEEAAALGLVLPAPGQVRYLKARPSIDARRASRSMAGPSAGYLPEDGTNEQAAAESPGDATGTETTPGGSALDPATGLPVDPATGRTTYDPVTGAAIDPATGLPYDPATATTDTTGVPASGASAGGADPATGAASGSRATGLATDPATGAPAG